MLETHQLTRMDGQGWLPEADKNQSFMKEFPVRGTPHHPTQGREIIGYILLQKDQASV